MDDVARMIKIWSDVLGRPIGAHEDFFTDIGGDSLDAVEIVATVEEDFAVELDLEAFVDHATPAALAEAVIRGLREQ
jgi:acyl carrier protein